MSPVEFEKLLDAVSFAARAHQHQIRKDRTTPYVAHPFRVCLILQQVFRIHDLDVLTAAVLHDTIEDTTTDFDDLAERYGATVADWVARLSKDTRLPDDSREHDYTATLAASGWQVQVCKLADMMDNLMDSGGLSSSQRERTLHRLESYLDCFRAKLEPEARNAFAIVEAAWKRLKNPS